VRVFHYTVKAKLQAILESGELRAAVAYVPAGERPAVWFSTNPWWEETANKMWKDKAGTVHRGDRRSTEQLGNGLIRIEVAPETAPVTWTEHKRSGKGPSRKDTQTLEKVARLDGADPSQWRLSYEPVPRDKWLTIELWNGVSWERLPDGDGTLGKGSQT
jgi:hypothetical protein